MPLLKILKTFLLTNQRLVFFVFGIFTSCTITDDVDPWVAQRRIINAYEAKIDQCRQKRSFEPFVFGTHREWEVRNCEGAILGAKCPLLERPQACFLLIIPRNP